MKYLKTFESEFGNIGLNNKLDEIKKEWQTNNPNKKLENNDYVKLIFENGKHKEAMWVKITGRIDDITYSGILYNTPVNPYISMIIQHSDPLEFTYDEIMDYFSEKENKQINNN